MVQTATSGNNATHIMYMHGDTLYAPHVSGRDEGCSVLLCSRVQYSLMMPLTLGREARDPELCVVMVSTVVMPSPTRAGAASMLIQKEIQDRMTISRLGMYIWIR